jgi:hypothetical protein
VSAAAPNGQPSARDLEQAKLEGALYVEFRGIGDQLYHRKLGHVPQHAALAAAEILEGIAASLRQKASPILLPR